MDKFGHLIGVPFEYGARGPAAFDCYGLIKECFRIQSGVVLPEFQSPTDHGTQAAVGAIQLQQWIEVPRQPGVLAAIRVGRLVSHCGFMLDDSTMIHAWKATGGVTTLRIDDWKQRIAGFYRYAG